MIMIKKSIEDFWLTDTIPIVCGTEYKVEWNNIDRQFWIYTVWGYTTISKRLLDRYFI
jgi:hypothetical protein